MIIVIPMAGNGSRFADVGIETPKPLIDVRGKWMLEWALKDLPLDEASKIIFIVRHDHLADYQLDERIKAKFGPKAIVVVQDVPPVGATHTVLLAKDHIDTDEDILLKDSDGWVRSDIASAAAQARVSGIRGILVTSNLPGERWSFARTDNQGKVVEVKEKERISDNCIVGAYYFTHGKDFVQYAEAAMDKGEKEKGEYFIAPLFQKMIDDGHHVVIEESILHDMGTPEALERFLRTAPKD